MSLRFYANSNIIVIGSSGSGKTTAVLTRIAPAVLDLRTLDFPPHSDYRCHIVTKDLPRKTRYTLIARFSLYLVIAK